MTLLKFIPAFVLTLTLLSPQNALAQREAKEALAYAQAIATYCVDGQWEATRCLDIMAKMNTKVAAEYMVKLQNLGRQDVSGVVEEGCAVASKINFEKMSAAALAEAYVLCINSMVEAEQATNQPPNKDLYNLMLIAYFCTSGSNQCAPSEAALKKNL